MRWSKDNDKNKQIERFTAEEIGKLWNCTFHEYPDLHPIDFWGERNGTIVAHAEIKGRKRTLDEYPTVIFSLIKHLNMLKSVYHYEIPALVVFHFFDGIYYVDVLDIRPATEGTQYGVGGRKYSRYGDRDEREPMIHIPIEQLKRATARTFYTEQGVDYKMMMGES